MMMTRSVLLPLIRGTLFVGLLSGSLLLSACSGFFGGPPTGNYAGKVSGSDAFIALVASDGKALAYVCDGKTLAEWFSGTVGTDGTLVATNMDLFCLYHGITLSIILHSLRITWEDPFFSHPDNNFSLRLDS
jgi:hypothetical protein